MILLCTLHTGQNFVSVKPIFTKPFMFFNQENTFIQSYPYSIRYRSISLFSNIVNKFYTTCEGRDYLVSYLYLQAFDSVIAIVHICLHMIAEVVYKNSRLVLLVYRKDSQVLNIEKERACLHMHLFSLWD
jgi:hypothetical protein